MAAKDRAKDDRRSVGSFEKMMGALGNAAGWMRNNVNDPHGMPHYSVSHDLTGKQDSFLPGEGHVKHVPNEYDKY
jgi:hypothetical protein